MGLFKKDKTTQQDEAEAMEAAEQKKRILQLSRETEVYASLILARAQEMREVLEHGTRAG